jgi:beta-lactam-binding protein with PASTA domain
MDDADASTSSSSPERATPDIALQMICSVALTMLGEVLGSTLTGRLLAGALGALLGAFLTAKGTHHGRRIVAVALLLALLDAGRAAAAQVSIGSRPVTRRSFSAALALRQPASILAIAAAGFALGTSATAATQGLGEEHEPDPLPPVTLVRVPALTGLSAGQATARLDRVGLSPSTIREHSNTSIGHVIAAHPAAGARVRKGSTVTLDISNGPPPITEVEVPALAGLPAEEAQARLANIGLSSHTAAVSSEARPGLVIDTRPAAGAKVARGANVTLEVSKVTPSPPGLKVPNVVGFTLKDANATLKGLGLGVALIREPSELTSGQVIATRPPAGNAVEKGSIVTLDISTGQRPKTPPAANIPPVTTTPTTTGG